MALGYFRNVTAAVKDDRTLVTAADHEVQEHLVTGLSAAFPEDGILAEEGDLNRPHRGSERVWVIDPIDGTAAFVSGLPVWGISVALFERGRPWAGFFDMPATGDRAWVTGPDHPVQLNGADVPPPTPRSLHGESVLLVGSKFHRAWTLDAAYRGKVRSYGSMVAHLCYVATGAADAALVGRAKLWDLGAGYVMALANGAVALPIGADGAALDLDAMLGGEIANTSLLVGQPRVVDAYRPLLARR